MTYAPITRTLRLVLPALALVAVCAQAALRQGPREAPTGPITASDRQQTIAALVKNMKEIYVFPDVAEKATADILQRQKNKEYDAIADGRAFAQKLTEDLRAICKDAHLNVSYRPEAIPTRQPQAKPTPEEERDYQERVRRSNGGYTKVERLNGNVGYVKIIGFPGAEAAKRPAQGAMEFVAGTDALIFDMRENSGGDPAGVQLICSYLFGDKEPVHLNSIYSRDTGKTEEYWTLAKVDGPRYLDREVFILTSPRCGSAGEEFCYNLQTRKRATLIGDRTWGGANPGGFVKLSDHFGAFIPNGRAINPITKTNWEGTGVIPDIKADPKDALRIAHKMAVESLLKNAKSEADKKRLSEVLKELEEQYKSPQG
jgi:retinol-binding protein 3